MNRRVLTKDEAEGHANVRLLREEGADEEADRLVRFLTGETEAVHPSAPGHGARETLSLADRVELLRRAYRRYDLRTRDPDVARAQISVHEHAAPRDQRERDRRAPARGDLVRYAPGLSMLHRTARDQVEPLVVLDDDPRYYARSASAFFETHLITDVNRPVLLHKDVALACVDSEGDVAVMVSDAWRLDVVGNVDDGVVVSTDYGYGDES